MITTISTVKSEDRVKQIAEVGCRSVYSGARCDDCHELGRMFGLLRTEASGRIAKAIPEPFALVDRRD
ncbi:hypothetical protein NE857_21585 [Nocardiopsis exhalans]|uniref:Uncharacterized protein n=1 Tax=Nocardiopsis exhalans TaxID=163604 RepID=A0ABY5D1Q0_9ACTN|nr:hypothetical protein [Nocardiopsis exhalans]USY17910.1 hypothetical protein NE857_21585 [Nocardiopsis exhalans]